MSDYEDGSDYRPNLGPSRDDEREAGPPPPPPPPVPGMPAGAAAGSAQDSSSVAALVLGVLTMILSLFCGLLAIPSGIAAIVLGVKGRARSQQMGRGSGLAVTGIVLGAVGIAIALIFLVVLAGLGVRDS